MTKRGWPASALGLLLALVLVLAGCESRGTGEQLLTTYNERLAGSLDVAVEPQPASPPPSITAVELAPIPVPADTIGLLDFLSLSGCELQINLGRRNSHLGRHASPSQQLLLDLEFLHLAPACSATIAATSPELAQQLDALSEARAKALPALIYNAILAGPEWTTMWRPPSQLGNYPAGTAGDITDTIGQLASLAEDWLGGDWHADNLEFELLLGGLRSGDGGALLSAAAEQQAALALADEQLAQRLQQGSLCPFGRDTERSQALRNVASRFFAGGVQPWLADLKRRDNALLAPTRRLEAALSDVLPENYRHWRDERDRQLAQLTEAPRRHAQGVSAALTDCGGIRGNAR